MAIQLVNLGFSVKGSTTTPRKIDAFQNAGIVPYRFTVGKTDIELTPDIHDFFQTDLLIITLPPKIRRLGPGYGIGQIEKIAKATRNFDGKVIYTSSTSVYPTNGKSHDEKSLTTDSSENPTPLLYMEKLLKNTFGSNLTILRLGGLFGYDRIPVKYFLAKREIDNGKFPVNYLHRDDAIKSIITIIQKQAWGKIYNVVAPGHPTRKEVFLKNAKTLNVNSPEFSNRTTGNFKIVNGDKMVKELGFAYRFADPLDFLYDQHYTPL